MTTKPLPRSVVGKFIAKRNDKLNPIVVPVFTREDEDTGLNITREEDRSSVPSDTPSKSKQSKDQKSEDDKHEDRISDIEMEVEEEFPMEKDPFFALDYFMALLNATVLEDVLTALRVLGQCNTEIRILKVLDDMPLHTVNKYSISGAETYLHLDEVNPKRLGCNEYKLRKLQRDRDDVVTTMTATYKALALAGGFRPLWEHNEAVDNENRHRQWLEVEEGRNKIYAKNLHKQLRQQRNHHKTTEYEYDSVGEELHKNIQDEETATETECRYVDRWQEARTEQHQQKIQASEGQLSTSIEHYKRRAEHESLVHGEVEMLVSVHINEFQEKLEDIMIKYEEDSEAIDLKRQVARNNYLKIHEKRKELEKMYYKHDKELREWIKFKEDRATAQKYAADMLRSAIIVQAWWRGLLVRLKIGPYRENKRKQRKQGKRK